MPQRLTMLNLPATFVVIVNIKIGDGH